MIVHRHVDWSLKNTNKWPLLEISIMANSDQEENNKYNINTDWEILYKCILNVECRMGKEAFGSQTMVIQQSRIMLI